MLPGPTIIRECSACGKYIAQDTIVSGNTCGCRFWTDGKTFAPMLPDKPWLVICQHCGTLVWIDEQKQVGESELGDPENPFMKICRVDRHGNSYNQEIEPWNAQTHDADKFVDALRAKTPTLQDYAGFLEAGVSDKEKKRYVRLRAWWAGNDHRRWRKLKKTTPLSSFEAQNLRALITLLDETEDNDRLLMAEALREIGEFADADKLLATAFKGEPLPGVSFIRDLNKKRISAVEEMRFE